MAGLNKQLNMASEDKVPNMRHIGDYIILQSKLPTVRFPTYSWGDENIAFITVLGYAG